MKRWCRLSLLATVTAVCMLVMLPVPAAQAAARPATRSTGITRDVGKGKAQAQSKAPQGRQLGARSPSRGRTSPRPPVIALEHLTTHAVFQLRPDLPSGGFSVRQMRSLATLLRCHHTGQRHAISRRLAEILYSTARHYRNAKLFIVAGYRAPRIAREKGNPKSPHKRGVACDFQVSGVANEDVRDFLRGTFRDIGVGYYPNSGFIHVDVGRKRGAYWVDYSAPGRPARYSAQAAPAQAASVARTEVDPETETRSE